MKTHIFDEHCAAWTKYPEANETYIRLNIQYLQASYKAQGYMYYNRICETFGIPWDPREENTCWYDVDYLPIDYEWSDEHNAFIIKIG